MSDGTFGILAGHAACLTAAFLWAVAVGLFRQPIEKYGARSVNLGKCLFAAVLQGLTVWALGLHGALYSAPGRSILLVAASGLVGLVLGDTALFGAVARIGVHRTLLLQTLAPVFTALIAWIWRGTGLTPAQIAGTLIILGGISLVVVSPSKTLDGEPSGKLSARAGAALASGLLLGVVAALGQGAGIVLAKEGMLDMPVMAATFLRLGSAAIGLLLIEFLSGRLGRLAALARDGGALAKAVPATILGTYLALFLMMAGVALAPAPVAAVLLGTSPVFSLFLETFTEKRPITLRGLLGTLLAVVGVGVLSIF